MPPALAPPAPRDPLPDGPRRVVVDALAPSVDGGRHPVKRVVGDQVTVEADLLVDGHDRLAGALLYRRVDGDAARDGGASASARPWREAPLRPVAAHPETGAAVNDRWSAAFVPDAAGAWEFTVAGWVDTYASWAYGVRRKLEAGQEIELELQAGANLFDAAASRAGAADRQAHDKDAESAREALSGIATLLREPGDTARRAEAALAKPAATLMRTYPDRSAETIFAPPLSVIADPPLAEFSAWYEMFPRSTGSGGRHGTFRDAEARLPYIADLGFDVVYLPPIHPVGRTFRKGPDNSLNAGPNDPGSPWAIGGPEGGHKDVHPQLGTLDDFRQFLQAARRLGLEVALDVAFQASPDHPYVKQHPEWFVHRPDGSIQYAENPPKKYQDIYPFDFGGPAWQSLWHELRDVFLHWIRQGVRVFRVDNPHTKPVPFWAWCIRSIKARHPEVIFLAEAFTRPKMMYMLAKIGFSQSYTYFTWRTSKAELTAYVRELADSDVREFFRPSFWPNTPDILPEHLQLGTRATFVARAVLAATLSPSWGIYGPAFELQEKVARRGAEEYARNEKYELREWPLDRPDSLRPLLKRLNAIRRENPGLHHLDGTRFHDVDNDMLIAYSRRSRDGENLLLVIVNLDPHHSHSGWVTLDLAGLGIDAGAMFQVHDLLGDGRYLWRGARNFVSLDPGVMPAQIFRIRRHIRSEQNFEYYL